MDELNERARWTSNMDEQHERTATSVLPQARCHEALPRALSDKPYAALNALI